MLINIFKSLLSRGSSREAQRDKQDELADQAAKAMAGADPRAAIKLYQEYLKHDPKNVDALNNLGVCLAEIGNTADAYKAFDLAYSLDDSNMAVVVNHARHLIDNKDIRGAMPQLIRARITIPQYPYINAVYASARLALGDPVGAKPFTLRAWLAQFDNLRLANSYMFTSAYSDIPESLLASEHVFWAETLPASNPVALKKIEEEKQKISKNRKIRIGYLSPDFRSHSVRYFFRPLLEGHDRSQFEIFLYHDSHVNDEQTLLIKAQSDAFHPIAELVDKDLNELIISHDLDVLIELAGHTSHNRLNLLKKRLARLQLTGLGYPPTTGLSTLDGKFLDPYLITAHADRYYSERPMVLPRSFWCFDPKEPAPLAEEPPVVEKGFITFACVGNIAKINVRMIRAWREVMRRVPKSRLVIRAVNFVDQEAVANFRKLLSAEKMPLKRIELVGPAAGSAFFTSYNEIDIILDTAPFNGGTTTCFAVYMGVPVVSLAGESLIGRMGASVLGNVGAADLVVDSEAKYIARAVALSQDLPYLRQFRKTARASMQASSLGNGAMFAGDLESVLREHLYRLDGTSENEGVYKSAILPLPAKELVRRAYMVLGYDQKDAASRIVDYCLRVYPDFAPAHILATESMTSVGDYLGAADYLRQRLSIFPAEHRSAVLFNIARCYLLSEKPDEAKEILDEVLPDGLEDRIDQLQFDMFRAALSAGVREVAVGVPTSRVLVLMPCDQAELYDALVKSVTLRCELPDGIEVEYQRCEESTKVSTYQKTLNRNDVDIVVILQKNIQIHSNQFFIDIMDALKSRDLLGFSGASRWSQVDWQFDAFESKAGGFFGRTPENKEMFEIRVQGLGSNRICDGLAVLDGSLLAFRRKSLINTPFDEELTQAGLLLEEAWAFEAGQMGLKLAVHRNLGVEIMSQVTFDQRYLAAAKMHLLERRGFDPFLLGSEDNLSISVPTNSCVQGVEILDRYFKY